MERQQVAYALIALMVFAVGALVLRRMHYGRERVLKRRRAGELAAYLTAMEAKARDE